MILNQLTLNNFGVYSGLHCLEFNSKNSVKNITLIGGMNGRGKTTILDAILLALYGKRSISFVESNMTYTEYLKKFVNKSANKEYTFVELSFSITINNESTYFLARREWDNSKARISDKLDVYKNGVYDQYLSTNWDTYVEQILPSGISGLFFFDAEKIGRLAEEETGNEMKESIKALLGIDTVDRLIKDVKRVVATKGDNVSYIRDNEEIEKLQNELKNTQLAISNLKQNHAGLVNKKTRLRDKLGILENDFVKKGGNLIIGRNELIDRKQKVISEIDLLKHSMIDLAAGPLPFMLVKSMLQKIYNSSKEDENIKAVKYATTILNKFEEAFALKVSNSGIEGKKEILSLLKAELRKFKLTGERNQVFNLSPFGLQQIEYLISSELSRCAGNGKKLTHSFNELEQALDQIEGHLLIDIDENEADKLLREIKQISQKIYDIESKEKELDNEINKLKTTEAQIVNTLNKLIQKVANERNDQDDAARIIKYGNITIDVMSRFKKEIQGQKISELSLRILECFEYITYKTSLVTKINIDPETLNLTLFDYNGDILLKSQLSAGEKQMLAIAYLWGLAQCSGHNLPVIIDTPIGRLDSSHRKNFITHYLPNAGKQVIILSTDEEINGDYLRLLDKHINRKYLLKYDDVRKATEIVEGYFQGEAS